MKLKIYFLLVAFANLWPCPRAADMLLRASFANMETLDDAHKLAIGDKISLRILEDQEDPREPMEPKALIVADHGDLEVPYLGRFKATGKTCRQLARELKAELEKDYYYQATIIIGLDFLSKSTGKVYVMGEVKMTGALELPGDEKLTVSKAILRAGGFTPYGDKKRVKVTRESAPGSGERRSFSVNVTQVVEKGQRDTDEYLEPGDIVFVPTKLINF